MGSFPAFLPFLVSYFPMFNISALLAGDFLEMRRSLVSLVFFVEQTKQANDSIERTITSQTRYVLFQRSLLNPKALIEALAFCHDLRIPSKLSSDLPLLTVLSKIL